MANRSSRPGPSNSSATSLRIFSPPLLRALFQALAYLHAGGRKAGFASGVRHRWSWPHRCWMCLLPVAEQMVHFSIDLEVSGSSPLQGTAGNGHPAVQFTAINSLVFRGHLIDDLAFIQGQCVGLCLVGSAQVLGDMLIDVHAGECHANLRVIPDPAQRPLFSGCVTTQPFARLPRWPGKNMPQVTAAEGLHHNDAEIFGCVLEALEANLVLNLMVLVMIWRNIQEVAIEDPFEIIEQAVKGETDVDNAAKKKKKVEEKDHPEKVQPIS